VWAVLLALALVQFAVAAHWSAHDLATLDDHCGICCHLDRLDQAISDGQQIESDVQIGLLELLLPAVSTHFVTPRYFAARAPPRSTLS